MNKPWKWTLTLYYMQGLPYSLVVILSEIFYKQFNLDNASITFYTSLLGLPWLLKPIWCPLIEHRGQYRHWIFLMQILMGFVCASLIPTITTHDFIPLTFCTLLFIGVISATHDFNADGFYVLSLSESQQNQYIGWRSASFQAGKLSCVGGLVSLTGYFETFTSTQHTWQMIYGMVAILIIGLGLYHAYVLPKPAQKAQTRPEYLQLILKTLRLPGTISTLATVALLLAGQMQYIKVLPLYMLDKTQAGLNLTTLHVGEIFGTAGTICMILGGIISSSLIVKFSLKTLFKPFVILMALSMLPLAFHQWINHSTLDFIALAIGFNQFAFGLVATAQMALILKWARQSKYTATAYAIATAVMVLGFIYPGLFAGAMQEALGYSGFFMWCAACCVPTFFFASKAIANTQT